MFEGDSASVNGRPSGGSGVHKPESEDPHWRQRNSLPLGNWEKIKIQLGNRSCRTKCLQNLRNPWDHLAGILFQLGFGRHIFTSVVLSRIDNMYHISEIIWIADTKSTFRILNMCKIQFVFIRHYCAMLLNFFHYISKPIGLSGVRAPALHSGHYTRHYLSFFWAIC